MIDFKIGEWVLAKKRNDIKLGKIVAKKHIRINKGHFWWKEYDVPVTKYVVQFYTRITREELFEEFPEEKIMKYHG